MPTSYNDRTIRRILEHLDQLDSEFRVIRFAAREGSTLHPPLLMGGSSAQRHTVLEGWFTEWAAATDEARQATASTREGRAAITAAIDELTKLRELGRSARDGAQG